MRISPIRPYSARASFSPAHPPHQPEIQGMRALAVLAVVCAHAKIPGLAGGFIGVDVFFVISGFLITRLLLAEFAAAGRIDLLAFWARRARRLLPNAYACLLVTLLLALLLFRGYDPLALAREIAFAALQVVNFHFAERAIDYFQTDMPASPVLHFWSLAVEEQFYAFWPLLLVAIGVLFRPRFTRATAILLALVWLTSFTSSVLLTDSNQPLAYFGTATRCWQLATGALLATGWHRMQEVPAPLRKVMTWFGLAAIFAGIWLIAEENNYPGLWALIPTFGAAILLAGLAGGRSDSILRQTLSLPLMQWIGARSYSWYLWHWPLLALPRIAYPESPYIEVIAVPLSLVVAHAAYCWIEIPFRRGRILPAPALPTLAGAAAALAAVIGAGYLYQPALLLIDAKVAARMTWIAAASRDAPQAEKEGCFVSKKDSFQPDCAYGDRAGRYRAVLFGDSHAGNWFAPLDAAAKQAGWQLRPRSKGACPSAEVKLYHNGKPYISCDEWRENVMQRLLTTERPDLVILANRTTLDYSGAIYEAGSGKMLFGDDAKEAWKAGLRSTITRLLQAGIEVLVIRDVPRMEKNFKDCLLAGGQCSATRERAVERYPALDADAAREFGNRIVLADFTDQFCSTVSCPASGKGVIFYRDHNHLTATYAGTFTPRMIQYLHLFAERLRHAPQIAEGQLDPPTSSITVQEGGLSVPREKN